MAEVIDTYLDEVRAHLHLSPEMERRVVNELFTHFQEKVSELECAGFSMEQAEQEAISSFGEARSIARAMYEAYSRGSWVDAFIGSQPHFIVAVLFATHFWHDPILLGIALGAIAVITIQGWRMGSPTWMYSWAGYAFFPLLMIGFLSRHPFASTFSFVFTGTGMPAPVWELALLALFYVFIVGLFVMSSVRVARRDWLFLSLMLLPLPVLIIWALTVEHTGDSLFRLLTRGVEQFRQWDAAMAYFCIILGITSALFVRLRQRVLKAGALITIGIVSGSLVVRSLWTDLGLAQLLVVSLGLFLVLIAPLFIHTFFAHEVTPKET